MGLEFVRFHTLHIFFDCHDCVDIHHIIGQRVFFYELLKLIPVDGIVHHFVQTGFYLRVIAVPHCFDQQFTQRPVIKSHLAENIKHFAAESLTFFFQLLEQTLEHKSLPRFRSYQIPQVANLRLADTMDASKTLLQAVRVPRQVIVYHQMRSLQVDPFTGGIRRDQDANANVLLEKLLRLPTLITEHPAVNSHHSFLTSKQGTNFVGEIIQSIPMLREDDEFLTLPINSKHPVIVLQQPGQFFPFAVDTTGTDLIGHLLQTL